MSTPVAKIISYNDKGSLMYSRLKLASGEKVYIKVILNESPFIGMWEIGSLNPITVFVDWLMSFRTKKRFAGLIQLWGIGAIDVGGSVEWSKRIGMFNKAGFSPVGQDGDMLSSVTRFVANCGSIQELNNELRKMETANW